MTKLNNKIENSIEKSFEKVSPLWPLQNFIAVNSLSGFDNLKFEEAIDKANEIFAKDDLSPELQLINIHSIKWLKPFIDISQATIKMPNRDKGLYYSFKELLIHDSKLHQKDDSKIKFINSLPDSCGEAIKKSLKKLKVKDNEIEDLILILVSTLPGFASHINYRQDWDHGGDFKIYPASRQDFIALRLIISCLIVKDKKQILSHLKQKNDKSKIVKNHKKLQEIIKSENNYRSSLLKNIKNNLTKDDISTKKDDKSRPKAQMVFCIDVRSESIRKSIELQDDYDTYGFAGFFGVPVAVSEFDSSQAQASCPVLLKPKHTIKEEHSCSHHSHSHKEKRALKGKENINIIKNFYQSIKYSFTTPFVLAEAFGLWCGLWMGFKTFAPNTTLKAKRKAQNFIKPDLITLPNTELKDQEIDQKFMSQIGISFEDQCSYALNSLNMMGLTSNFAKIVLLCGHGSKTENNAYASALDCGACGGRHGGINAKILATILNEEKIRKYLKESDINIPQDTYFLGALHNTTTDEIKIYKDHISQRKYENLIAEIKYDLKKAQRINTQVRMLEIDKNQKSPLDSVNKLSSDWSQTRPEWGLAKNASFIVGPRSFTKNIDLSSQSFLHSYDYKIDENNNYLEVIMTAPMIVAHWINSQYFFSTFDNNLYGCGSKITQNITGKIGTMQGNSSDLMSGLSIQSVNKSDYEAQHNMIRLNSIIFAPRKMIDNVINKHENLQKLIKNQWIFITSIEENKEIYSLESNLSWSKSV